MTTINNLSIEKMREIVEGAPDTDMPMHYNVTNGVWIMSGFANRYFVDGEWKLLKDTNLGHFEFKTVSINELRTAIAQHYQDFEKFLTENDMPIRKSKDGYLFSNRLVYDAWVKRPELGLKKIYELKNTKIYLQGGMEAERHG